MAYEIWQLEVRFRPGAAMQRGCKQLWQPKVQLEAGKCHCGTPGVTLPGSSRGRWVVGKRLFKWKLP